jgi:hypothetical protein
VSKLFISYEKNNSQVAEILALLLQENGYTTWAYDLNSLPAVPYLKQVVDAIDQSEALILIISPQSILSNQVNNEIVMAYEKRKVIVPLLLEITHAEFQQLKPEWRLILGAATSIRIPSAGVELILPRIVAALNTLAINPQSPQGIILGATKSETLPVTRNTPQGTFSLWIKAVFINLIKHKFLVGIISVMLITTGFFLVTRIISDFNPLKKEVSIIDKKTDKFMQKASYISPSSSSEGLSEISLKEGKLLFRTERLEAYKKDKTMALKTRNDIDEVVLSFQIINQSNEVITISSLQILLLGKIIIYEDNESTKNQVLQQNLKSLSAERERERVDLGVLKFSVGDNDKMQSTESGSLLVDDRVETIPPYSSKSFFLKLGCVESERNIIDAQFIGIIGESLSALDVTPPEPNGVAHVFIISADLLTGYGERHRLYSDWVYSLYPKINRDISLKIVDKKPSEKPNIPLVKWSGLELDQFTREIIDWAIKIFQETLAYQVVKKTGNIPENFDATDISEFCYYHDQDSPLRKIVQSKPAKSQLQEFEITRFIEPHPRSNIAEVFEEIFRKYPSIGAILWRHINELEKSDNLITNKKARYIRKILKDKGVV